jgi:hypothetical protein
MDTTVAIRELRACLTVAIGLGLGPACADEPSCPLTARAAQTSYVCFDPVTQAPASTSSAEMTGDASTPNRTSSGADETMAATESSVTGETTASTGGDGPLCTAFAAPPNTTYDDYRGPFEDNGLCCYTVTVEEVEEEEDSLDTALCGRPFVVDGDARVAPCVVRNDWATPLHPIVDGIDAPTRDALAAAWMRDAAAEHASVAAFARFALQLMAVAAPPELVLETQRAMADEVEHARMCFALASAYAGAPIGPGALSIASSSAVAVELADVVASTMIEGCIGETVAALVARLASVHAVDPIVRGVLEHIADDELRHAALAWRFVAWAVSHGDASVRRTIVRTTQAPRALAIDDAMDLRAHGRLPAAEIAALHLRVHAEIVGPLVASLLDDQSAARNATRSASSSSSKSNSSASS